MNGNDFQIKDKFILLLDLPKHSTGHLYPTISVNNGSYSYMIRQSTNSESNDYIHKVTAEYIDGYGQWEYESVANDFNGNYNLHQSNNEYSSTSNAYGITKDGLMVTKYSNIIESIKLKTTNHEFPANTQVAVYGIRA